MPVEKADETRVIFIVRGWWGDKQHTPSTGGRRDALHFRYDDNSKHPTTLQLFIVTYLLTTGHGSDRYGKHETERRGVSGSKRKPLNGISAEQKTEKAGGKSAAESGGNVDIPPHPPTRSTLIDQSKRMKYWQWPIGNYLYNARNEQFTREN